MQHPHIAYPPADGERRAISGYYPQYRIAASLILRSLREASLQWTRIADPQAGRVDDLQIGSQSRIDAFQVKWSQYQGTFTFGELTKASGNAPALIAQLADGWKRLRAAYPGSRIVVHLVTNAISSPSPSQHMPSGEPPPTPHHFAAFIEQVWKPAQKAFPHSHWSIPQVWRPTWDALQVASGLCATDFTAFVQDCEFEFGYHLYGSEIGTTRDQQIAQADLEHLAHTLFSTVADPERIIEFTREQLLARLGWQARLEYRNRHEFPVDEALYQPIEATVHQLQSTLDSLPGGYIAVLGTPGSGKSTLLTQTLRGCPERVIRYYAYVPDAQDPSSLRGESENFLHDVTLALERAGCRVGASPSIFDRSQLLLRFHQQLQHLHEDWQATGHKTVILIDGLDHIAREQHPQHSLLRDLPLPNQVPEGVYMILGSQTAQLEELPDRVQHAILQSGRCIQMQPLSREAVLRVIERVNLPVSLSPEQMERSCALSEGHPLALAYLVKRLQGVSDPKAIDTVLDTTQPYEGNIEEQYHSYWRQIEDDDQELAHLFGLLARLRRVIDLAWVETWTGRAVIERLRRSAYYYFKPEDPHRWYFFHNSFRLFLIQHSAAASPGVSDSSRNCALHRELAEICAQAPETSYWSWEELYHRIAAEEHEVVLQKAHPEWFRNQFLAFRPLDAIQTDIRLALRSAKVCQDPVALSRLILAGAEMAQRAFYLERSASILSLLLSLDEKQVAVEYVRDGNRLRIGPESALRISLDLKNARLDEEAQRVFELAEPLDLLDTHSPIEQDYQDKKGEMLTTWAEAAIHFRSVDNIIETIRKLRREADRFAQIDDEAATRSLQNRLLYKVGLALLAEQRWDELSKIARKFNINYMEDLQWWFWLQVHAWKDCATAGDKAQAVHFLEQAIEASISGLNHNALLASAEGVYRLLEDREGARELLQYVPQPNLRYDRLIQDLTGEFWYPQNLALELDVILPLLTDEVPIQAIWPMVEQYVHTLFEGCSLPIDSPDLDEQPSHDSPSRAIADLLILHIDHPVYAVAQASKRTCVKLLLQRDLAVQSAVHECLEKTESQQEHILRVLDAVSLHGPSVVAPFRNKILSLHQSPSYAIRRAAQIIGKRIGCEQTVADPHPMPLPAIYQLSFPQRSTGRLIDPETISGEEPLSDSDDPVDIIRAVVLSVDLIAEKARLPKVNMYHHTAQIMQQLAPLSSWSEDGEKQLRSTLVSAGLHLTFYRPRAVLARRAMFHIIAELIDAHALGTSELFQLDSGLRFYDPHMILLEPIQRPASVAAMEGKNRPVGVTEAWLEQAVETADSACCKTDDGLIVLAEETTLKWLEWGTPTEVRRSVVAQSKTLYPEAPDAFFSKTVNRLVSEYPFLRAGTATSPLVFRHSDYAYDSPGKNWLALNPAVGSRLSWSVAEDGLFRWVNVVGQIMVESIWWTDGLVGQTPPHFDDEVGEGWLVVASQAARDAITSQLGTLKRMIHVERSFSDKEARLQSNMHAERILER